MKPSLLINEDEKKTIENDKPFGNRMIRLKKNTDVDQPKEEIKEDISNFNSKPSIEVKPTLGLKGPSQNRFTLDDNPSPVQDTKPIPEVVVEEKPIIAPRRMMLRKRGDEDNSGGGYNPNFVKKEEPVIPAPVVAPTVPVSVPNPVSRNIGLRDDEPVSKPMNNPYAPTAQQ